LLKDILCPKAMYPADLTKKNSGNIWKKPYCHKKEKENTGKSRYGISYSI
jgi:hypothetical protein